MHKPDSSGKGILRSRVDILAAMIGHDSTMQRVLRRVLAHDGQPGAEDFYRFFDAVRA